MPELPLDPGGLFYLVYLESESFGGGGNMGEALKQRGGGGESGGGGTVMQTRKVTEVKEVKKQT